MQESITASTVFYVSQVPNGGWAVFGSDISPPLWTFEARDSAIEHACARADHVALGEVQVLDWSGAVDEYLVRESICEDRSPCRRAISRT
jgi:hypothetical protein